MSKKPSQSSRTSKEQVQEIVDQPGVAQDAVVTGTVKATKHMGPICDENTPTEVLKDCPRFEQQSDDRKNMCKHCKQVVPSLRI